MEYMRQRTDIINPNYQRLLWILGWGKKRSRVLRRRPLPFSKQDVRMDGLHGRDEGTGRADF